MTRHRMTIQMAGAAVAAWALGSQSVDRAAAQSITPPAAQSQNHDGSDAPQVFAEAVWSVNNPSIATGATAQLSSGPFVNASRSSLKSDCQLSLRIVSSSGMAGWTAIAPLDQTSFGGGDETAVVVANSTKKGNGQLGLTVTFINSDYSILGAGQYLATVTGTIVAN